jgi:hypothetical protein
LNNGDTVTIGGVNEAGFNITAVITRISATSFTYVKALPQNPGFVYNATFAPGAATATVPAAYIPNLVRARSVADLDAAPNFLVPYRVAFPVSLPGAPLVSTGG